jgi:hypothetical protein
VTHGTRKTDYPVAFLGRWVTSFFLARRYFGAREMVGGFNPAQVRNGKGFPLVFHQTARRRRLSR